MATEVAAPRRSTRRMSGVSWSSIGMLIAALLSAPCFLGVILIPIGLGALVVGSVPMFLDTNRYVLMAIAIVLLAGSHLGLRKAREFRPTKLLGTLTVLTVVLIVGELIVDSPLNK